MTEITKSVKARYGAIARDVREGASSSCCGPACGCEDPISSNLYEEGETLGLPREAVTPSEGRCHDGT